MEIKLLKDGYKNIESLYEDFKADMIAENEEYFSEESVYIDQTPSFPIYIAKGSTEHKKKEFLEAFNTVTHSYLSLDRSILLSEHFWHSFLLIYKRNYIIGKYPEVLDNENKFKNIVLKKLDWENYIYKIILGAQYIADYINNEDQRQRYFGLIIDNLDLYNYIIKYEIFRNDDFLINILDIIDELGLSEILKAKIKGREDLGDDERYGRRVIFELNKSYPIVLSPMLSKDDLKDIFIEYLGYYYDVSDIKS
ncbi:hypothetical protein HMI01_06520 [Halolactibacillus miurensis]|uniref:Uncharacterized protein n=1 Tax=Halolactibacillus miurensis TaxID=306541 RepID=A0A1I6R1C1_9BACI|nr:MULTISPECIES: hypothetical protein [Halolactibacillus]GEM03664.1 hypothetical protein HMI01_06520 [Halolactibacillus miurensis]SFS58521.1 hypothetical protein SAMN05421668_10524 [Halolactibacillus miurensis]